MPATNGRQYRAMVAAANGQGRLGIPQDVAHEYVAKTKPSKRSQFAFAAKNLAKRHRRS